MRRILLSFSYALTGIFLAWKRGHNFKLQILAAVSALLLSAALPVSGTHFALILIVIAVVLAAETFNTALEELCDKFQPDHDPHIARIKDLAAGAVLITSFFALLIALVIFGSYL